MAMTCIPGKSRSSLPLLACLLACAALAQPAAAQESAAPSGWYGGSSVSLSLLNDTGGTIANAPVPGSTVLLQNPVDSGYGVQLALGYYLGDFRLEAEAGYSHNTQDHYTAIAPPTGSIPANVKDTAVRGMVNGYYELPTQFIRPYLGAGLGLSRVDINFFAPRAPFPSEAPRQLIKDGDTRFTYQLIGGIAVPLNTDVALTLEYRWLDAGTVVGKDVRGERITRDQAGHNLGVGLRVNF